MPLSLYDACVPVMSQMLGGLAGVIDKAAAYCDEKKVEPAALLTARLYPNMFVFRKQVQVATDWARNTAGGLAVIEIPKIDDNEEPFKNLKKQISPTFDFLKPIGGP